MTLEQQDPNNLAPDYITAFQQNGAVCLRQLLSQSDIELLREGIEHNLKCLSWRAKTASKLDDPGYFVEDFCTWQTNPYYQRFIFDSPLGQVASQLMQSQTARLYHDHLLVKEPGTRPRRFHEQKQAIHK